MIKLHEPQPYRVYQRNQQNQADIGIRFAWAGQAGGKIEVCLDSTGEWLEIGRAENGENEFRLRDVAAGKHAFQLRVLSVDGPVKVVSEPIYVGDLWVLAGQSNMQGCGALSSPDVPKEGVSCYYLDDRWALAEDPLCWNLESTDPVHWLLAPEERPDAIRKTRRDRVSGAGLGIAFGKEVLRNTGVPIGLVVCPLGGTAMRQWMPNPDAAEGESLYGSMIRRIRAVGGRVKGCLWYQGESDANEADAPLFKDRMHAFVASLRKDCQNPNLPFLQVQIASVHNWSPPAVWWNSIQHAQLELVDEIPGLELVPSLDSTLSDPIHLDGPSLRRVGVRLARGALRLAYGYTDIPVGPRPDGCYWNEDRTQLFIAFKGLTGNLQCPTAAVYGFSLKLKDEPLPHTASLTVNRKCVKLSLDAPAPAEGVITLQYGEGFYPVTSLTDEAGMPLVAFGPIPVT